MPVHSSLIPIRPEDLNRNEYDARAARISAVFKANKKEERDIKRIVNPQVGRMNELKAKILAMSLFPNLMNQKALEREM